MNVNSCQLWEVESLRGRHILQWRERSSVLLLLQSSLELELAEVEVKGPSSLHVSVCPKECSASQVHVGRFIEK